MKKNIMAVVLATVVLSSSFCVNAYNYGTNSSYALRQLAGVPSQSNVYTQEAIFYGNTATTTMTCTQNTTSGATVLAASTNGIAGLLNVSGASFTAPTTYGQLIVAKVVLEVPDSTYTYTGYGTITN